MTKITGTQYRALTTALAGAYDMTYIDTDAIVRDGKVIEFGINWGCRGLQSVEATMHFMTELKNATIVADHLNQMEIEVDYDAEEKVITSIEEYNEQKMKMRDCFKQGSLLYFRRMVRINGLND